MCRGMSTRRVGDRCVLTFEDIPATYYAALRRSARLYPHAVAIIDDDGTAYTYEHVLALTDGTARALHASCGIDHASRVGLLLDTSVEYVCAFFACNRLGAVCVPLSTKYREDEVTAQVSVAHLDLLLLDERFERWGERLSELGVKVISLDRSRDFALALSDQEAPVYEDAGDVAAMLFTSGTTSRAKGVLLSNVGIMHAAEVYARLEATTSHDVTIIPVPIYHVTGLFALLVQYLHKGATVILHKRFNARRVLTAVRDQGITHIHAAPTALAKLMELANDFPSLPSLRLVLSGSSTAPVKLLKQWHEWLPTCVFKTVYGLTETSSPACVFPCDAPTSICIGSSGKPVPGVDLDVVDDEGNPIAVGEVGEIVLHGAVVALGYEYAEGGTVFDAFCSDGWFKTGDMGYVNEEGMLWVVSRKKDIINRGGEKVWSCSLEERLRDLDGVADACVVGVPDDIYGEVVCAAIVSAEGFNLSEEDIKEQLCDRVARFEIPEHILFVSKIPQTAGDKLDRQAVRSLVLTALDK